MTRAKVVIGLLGLLLGLLLLVLILVCSSLAIRAEQQVIAERLCSINDGALLTSPVEIKHRSIVPIGSGNNFCTLPIYRVSELNTALRAVFPEKPTSPPNG
jgi:hypothetical protein